MDTVWLILKILVAIAACTQLILWLIVIKRMKWKHADLSSMSIEDLRSLAVKLPFLHCNKVIQELNSRNEDISFALPLLLKLAADRNAAAQIIGWGGLKQYFADQLPDLDFSKNRPNSNEQNWIKSRLNKMENPISRLEVT
jgi:hypothetical protein